MTSVRFPTGPPQAPFLHLFLPRGAVTLEGVGPLHTGDAARFTATGGHKITATEPTEILLWKCTRPSRLSRRA